MKKPASFKTYINEISNTTINRYEGKARKSLANAASSNDEKTYQKRMKGLTTASIGKSIDRPSYSRYKKSLKENQYHLKTKQVKEDASDTVSGQFIKDADFYDKIEAINIELDGITGSAMLTPYVGLEKVSKTLARFNIILPRVQYLEPEGGEIVLTINPHETPISQNIDGTFSTTDKKQDACYVNFAWTPTEDGWYDIYAEIADERKDLDLEEEAINELGDTPAGKKALAAISVKRLTKAYKSDLGSKDYDKNTKIGRNAFKRLVKKKEESINELSKKTLGSYVNKAVKQLPDVESKAKEWPGEISGRRSKDPRFRAYHNRLDYNKKQARVKSRKSGIEKAVNKLSEDTFASDASNYKRLATHQIKSGISNLRKKLKAPPKRDSFRADATNYVNHVKKQVKNRKSFKDFIH